MLNFLKHYRYTCTTLLNEPFFEKMRLMVDNNPIIFEQVELISYRISGISYEVAHNSSCLWLVYLNLPKIGQTSLNL